jgi:uncharacterized protein with HEPN domain
MSEERLRGYLDQMRTAAETACGFLSNMEQDAFVADIRTQMAVAMALVLIGENAARIAARDPNFLVEHPEIPWSKMRGMRNVAVHDYADLELSVIFNTVKTSLPELLTQLDLLRNWRAQGE